MGSLYSVSSTTGSITTSGDVSATGSVETALSQVANTQTSDQTISSGFSASVPVFYAIAVGITLTISTGSYFQVI